MSNLLRRLAPPVAGLALATGAAAQNLNATVGPDPAPLGCPVSITVSNDQPGSWSSLPCPFRVFDASMQLVYEPTCPPITALIGPYGWVTATWPQTDQGGAPVPPGDYVVEVSYDGGLPSTLHPITVGGTDANLVLEGTATIGQTLTGEPRHFYLCAPEDAGYAYFLAASFSADVGVPTCGGLMPLDPDPLLNLTLGPGTIFADALGVLGPDGTSHAPDFPVPPSPGLVGLDLVAAFAVLDLAAPCPIRRTSEPYALTIIG